MPSNEALILEVLHAAEAVTSSDDRHARRLLERAAKTIRRLRKITGRGPTGNVADAAELLDDVARSMISGLTPVDQIRAALRDAAVMMRDLKSHVK
jgi:hypothetical protein